MRGHTRLNIDDRDRVGDRVVDLASDAQSLRVDARPGLLLPSARPAPSRSSASAAMNRRDRTDSPSAALMTDAPIRKNTQPIASRGSTSAPAINQTVASTVIPRAGEDKRPAPVAVRSEGVQGDEQAEPAGSVGEVQGVVQETGTGRSDEDRRSAIDGARPGPGRSRPAGRIPGSRSRSAPSGPGLVRSGQGALHLHHRPRRGRARRPAPGGAHAAMIGAHLAVRLPLRARSGTSTGAGCVLTPTSKGVVSAIRCPRTRPASVAPRSLS